MRAANGYYECSVCHTSTTTNCSASVTTRSAASLAHPRHRTNQHALTTILRTEPGTPAALSIAHAAHSIDLHSTHSPRPQQPRQPHLPSACSISSTPHIPGQQPTSVHFTSPFPLTTLAPCRFVEHLLLCSPLARSHTPLARPLVRCPPPCCLRTNERIWVDRRPPVALPHPPPPPPAASLQSFDESAPLCGCACCCCSARRCCCPSGLLRASGCRGSRTRLTGCPTRSTRRAYSRWPASRSSPTSPAPSTRTSSRCTCDGRTWRAARASSMRATRTCSLGWVAGAWAGTVCCTRPTRAADAPYGRPSPPHCSWAMSGMCSCLSTTVCAAWPASRCPFTVCTPTCRTTATPLSRTSPPTRSSSWAATAPACWKPRRAT